MLISLRVVKLLKFQTLFIALFVANIVSAVETPQEETLHKIVKFLASNEMGQTLFDLPRQGVRFKNKYNEKVDIALESSVIQVSGREEQKKFAQFLAQDIAQKRSEYPEMKTYHHILESEEEDYSQTLTPNEFLQEIKPNAKFTLKGAQVLFKNQGRMFANQEQDFFKYSKIPSVSLPLNWIKEVKQAWKDPYTRTYVIVRAIVNSGIKVYLVFQASKLIMPSVSHAVLASSAVGLSVLMGTAGYMIFNPQVQSFLNKRGLLEKANEKIVSIYQKFYPPKKATFLDIEYKPLTFKSAWKKVVEKSRGVRRSGIVLTDDILKFSSLEYLFLGIVYSTMAAVGAPSEFFGQGEIYFIGQFLFTGFLTATGQGALETLIAKVTKFLNDKYPYLKQSIRRVSDGLVAAASIVFVSLALAADSESVETIAKPLLRGASITSAVLYVSGLFTLRPYTALAEKIIVGNPKKLFKKFKDSFIAKCSDLLK